MKKVHELLIGMKMAIIEINQYKMRSAMSIVGIVVGVFSIVSMLALIRGMEKTFSDTMAEWSSVMKIIRKDPSEKKVLRGISPFLRYDDGNYLESNYKYVNKYRNIITMRKKILFEDIQLIVSITGASKEEIIHEKKK